MIRRAYYTNSTREIQKEDFDLGIDRFVHVGHCFDYLRQGILCSADSGLESVREGVNINIDFNWGFQRVCRDYQGLKAWAEKWRAYEIKGSFIPSELHFQDD